MLETNHWILLGDIVEDGIDAGWARSHKHTDEPTEELIKEHIYQAIMDQIAEYYRFPPHQE